MTDTDPPPEPIPSPVAPPEPAAQETDDERETRERESMRQRVRDQRATLELQRRHFGRMRFGVAFFGWLTATGLTVLLTGLISAVAAGLGQSAATGRDDHGVAVGAGVVGVAVLMLVLLLAYFCGGYVAGRMARFSGLKQGVAVWLWGVIVTAVLSIVGVVVGSQFDVLSRLGALPSISLSGGDALAGVLALLGVIVSALLGALLGGVTGMRFHRRVDRVDAFLPPGPSRAEARTPHQEHS